MKFEIRDLGERDLDAACVLSAAVQWPHRREDWQFALSVGDGIAAFADGRLIGTAMWWEYEHKIARIGMVIVDPELQRSGIGGVLMQRCLERVASCCLMLTATGEGAPLYRKLGFQVSGSIFQHQGQVRGCAPAALPAGSRIRPARNTDADELVALDANACGVHRDKIILALMRVAEVVVIEQDAALRGFAICRRFGRGHVAGPVAARDAVSAQALIGHWIGVHAGSFLRIDVDGAAGLSEWLEANGLARVDHVETMVRGDFSPSMGNLKYFAIVNQALG